MLHGRSPSQRQDLTELIHSLVMSELSKRERTYKRADENRPRNGQRFPFAKGPSLGETIDAYHREHAHRRKASILLSHEALIQVMASNRIEENFPMIAPQKHQYKVFKAGLLNRTATGRRRKPGPVTIQSQTQCLEPFHHVGCQQRAHGKQLD